MGTASARNKNNQWFITIGPLFKNRKRVSGHTGLKNSRFLLRPDPRYLARGASGKGEKRKNERKSEAEREIEEKKKKERRNEEERGIEEGREREIEERRETKRGKPEEKNRR